MDEDAGLTIIYNTQSLFVGVVHFLRCPRDALQAVLCRRELGTMVVSRGFCCNLQDEIIVGDERRCQGHSHGKPGAAYALGTGPCPSQSHWEREGREFMGKVSPPHWQGLPRKNFVLAASKGGGASAKCEVMGSSLKLATSKKGGRGGVPRMCTSVYLSIFWACRRKFGGVLLQK